MNLNTKKISLNSLLLDPNTGMVRRYAHLAPERFTSHARVVDALLNGTATAQLI
ncbi:MAG: hypothetical protein WDN72_03105 [Alphaproteobacteria bacterium]